MSKDSKKTENEQCNINGDMVRRCSGGTKTKQIQKNYLEKG